MARVFELGVERPPSLRPPAVTAPLTHHLVPVCLPRRTQFLGRVEKAAGRIGAEPKLHDLTAAKTFAGDGAYLVCYPFCPLNVAAPLRWPKHPAKFDSGGFNKGIFIARAQQRA